MTRTFSLGALSAVVLLLAGCASPGPVQTPSPGDGPAGAPTPTVSAEPDAGVTELVIQSGGLELRDADGNTDAFFTWFDEPAATLTALSAAFGVEPEEVPYAGHIEAAPGTDYTWEGFVLRVQDFQPVPPTSPNTSAVATSEALGPVAITAEGGVTIGSAADHVLEQEIYQHFDLTQEPVPTTAYWLDQVELEVDASGTALHHYVSVKVADTVVKIQAPSADFGV